MIQRVQSIYLLVSALVLSAILAVPYAAFEGVSGQQTLSILGGRFQRADGLTIVDTFQLIPLILLSISTLLLLGSIFLFKNRKLQVKLVNLSMFSTFIFLLSLGTNIYRQIELNMTQNLALSFNFAKSLGLLIPIIALVFAWLATRGIKRDEELVRSADRIR